MKKFFSLAVLGVLDRISFSRLSSIEHFYFLFLVTTERKQGVAFHTSATEIKIF